MEKKNENSFDATFAVMLLNPENRHTGKGTMIYSGDDGDAAKKAADEESRKLQNIGKFIRFYDFRFLGGGMRDMKIVSHSN